MIGVPFDDNDLTCLGSVPEVVMELVEAGDWLLVDGCVARDPAAWIHAWSVLPWVAEPARRVARRAAV